MLSTIFFRCTFFITFKIVHKIRNYLVCMCGYVCMCRLVSMHKIQFAYGFLVANIYLRFLISMCNIHRIWNVASHMCKCKGRQSRMSSVFFSSLLLFCFQPYTNISISNMQRSESAFKRIQIKVRIFQIAYICNELS